MHDHLCWGITQSWRDGDRSRKMEGENKLKPKVLLISSIKEIILYCLNGDSS